MLFILVAAAALRSALCYQATNFAAPANNWVYAGRDIGNDLPPQPIAGPVSNDRAYEVATVEASEGQGIMQTSEAASLVGQEPVEQAPFVRQDVEVDDASVRQNTSPAPLVALSQDYEKAVADGQAVLAQQTAKGTVIDQALQMASALRMENAALRERVDEMRHDNTQILQNNAVLTLETQNKEREAGAALAEAAEVKKENERLGKELGEAHALDQHMHKKASQRHRSAVQLSRRGLQPNDNTESPDLAAQDEDANHEIEDFIGVGSNSSTIARLQTAVGGPTSFRNICIIVGAILLCMTGCCTFYFTFRTPPASGGGRVCDRCGWFGTIFCFPCTCIGGICSLGPVAFMMFLGIMAMAVFGAITLWQAQIIQPILNQMVSYLYLLVIIIGLLVVFIVELGGKAMEKYELIRDQIDNVLEALHIKEDSDKEEEADPAAKAKAKSKGKASGGASAAAALLSKK